MVGQLAWRPSRGGVVRGGGGEFGSIDDGPSVPPRTSPTNTVQMLMR